MTPCSSPRGGRKAHARPAPRAVYKRSPWTFVYWARGRLLLHHSISGETLEATPLIVGVVDALDEWSTPTALATRIAVPAGGALARLLLRMSESGFLERHAGPRPPASADGAADWGGWHPVAAFFHHGTRDVPYEAPADVDRRLRAKARRDPPPATVVSRAGRRVQLPSPLALGELSDVLKARRTWRAFAPEPLTSTEVSTLLWLTWGIQAWAEVKGFPPMALTTSPSPGARRGTEVYLLVRRVAGLTSGMYHYDAAGHTLTRLSGASGPRASALVPQQPWIDDAPIVCFMTAVFARTRWRYPHPRAYRTLLTEVGHHAQSFCLLATAMTLAPFCTMALADTAIERALGLDGNSEAVLYAVGAGRRPVGVDWAPWPGTTKTPRLRQNVPKTPPGVRRLA